MKRILTMLMAVALGLTGCAGPGAKPVRTGYTLASPSYPEFPACPQTPEDPEDVDAWQEYLQVKSGYDSAVEEFRGDRLPQEVGEKLTAFAQRSVPLALAGEEGKNAVYSPLSLWSAMAMLAQCAGEESRQQILEALETDCVEDLQAWVAQVWRRLYIDDGASSLLLANSIWLNSALEGKYVQETLDTLAERYYAGAYTVPMGQEEADQAVTDWVKEQTHGLIGGGSPVVETEAEDLALLASSLYYRAGWRAPFRAERTGEDVFTDAAGQEHVVDFMHQDNEDYFLIREEYQAARLETQLGEMVFVLPSEGTAPEELLQKEGFLSGLEFRSGDYGYGKVQWSMPKFDVDSTLRLEDTLREMGAASVLDQESGGLSALTVLDAYVSEVKQMARVKVDEEGVEAAAVTMTLMCGAAARPEPDICVMDLDRPFLFVIRTEGIPLFVGVVNQVE